MTNSGKLLPELGRLERELRGVLQLHAKELQHSMERMAEDIAELEQRLCNVENEVAALIQREGDHGI